VTRHQFPGLLADQQVTAHFLGGPHDPRGDVGRVADDGILHPLLGADVPGHHGPGVDADLHPEGQPSLPAALLLPGVHGSEEVDRGVHGAQGVVGLADRGVEEDHHAVTLEALQGRVMLHDDGNHHVVVFVEQIDGLDRVVLLFAGYGREAVEVREEDGGRDHFAGPLDPVRVAGDLARDRRADVASEEALLGPGIAVQHQDPQGQGAQRGEEPRGLGGDHGEDQGLFGKGAPDGPTVQGQEGHHPGQRPRGRQPQCSHRGRAGHQDHQKQCAVWRDLAQEGARQDGVEDVGVDLDARHHLLVGREEGRHLQIGVDHGVRLAHQDDLVGEILLEPGVVARQGSVPHVDEREVGEGPPPPIRVLPAGSGIVDVDRELFIPGDGEGAQLEGPSGNHALSLDGNLLLDLEQPEGQRRPGQDRSVGRESDSAKERVSADHPIAVDDQVHQAQAVVGHHGPEDRKDLDPRVHPGGAGGVGRGPTAVGSGARRSNGVDQDDLFGVPQHGGQVAVPLGVRAVAGDVLEEIHADGAGASRRKFPQDGRVVGIPSQGRGRDPLVGGPVQAHHDDPGVDLGGRVQPQTGQRRVVPNQEAQVKGLGLQSLAHLRARQGVPGQGSYRRQHHCQKRKPGLAAQLPEEVLSVL